MTLKEAYTYLGLFPMPFKLFRIIIHELKEQFQAGDTLFYLNIPNLLS